MAKQIRWRHSTLSEYNNCALGIIHDFAYDFGRRHIHTSYLGTGYFIAGFANTPECRAAYHALQRDARIMYQSEVRQNKFSGNKYFFCVFDANV